MEFFIKMAIVCSIALITLALAFIYLFPFLVLRIFCRMQIGNLRQKRFSKLMLSAHAQNAINTLLTNLVNGQFNTSDDTKQIYGLTELIDAKLVQEINSIYVLNWSIISEHFELSDRFDFRYNQDIQNTFVNMRNRISYHKASSICRTSEFKLMPTLSVNIIQMLVAYGAAAACYHLVENKNRQKIKYCDSFFMFPKIDQIIKFDPYF